MDKRIEEIKSKHQDLDSVDIANLKSIQKDLDLLEKYQNLIINYRSLKGRNLTISIEELCESFKELEDEV